MPFFGRSLAKTYFGKLNVAMPKSLYIEHERSMAGRAKNAVSLMHSKTFVTQQLANKSDYAVMTELFPDYFCTDPDLLGWALFTKAIKEQARYSSELGERSAQAIATYNSANRTSQNWTHTPTGSS